MNLSAGWQFRILGFPVRVQFSFFLIALLLGLQINNIFYLLLWVIIVFVSVLLHELGHAVASRYYGRTPYIELYAMGGKTISTRYSLLSYPKEILISFSGPLAGFLLGGLLFALYRLLEPVGGNILNFILSQLLWVNIGWGILNLIPVLPLDGGTIMRNLYHWLKNPYDERTPLKISIGFGILAVIAALILLRSSGLYLAMLMGWLTLGNYMSLRQGYPTNRFN